MMLRKDKEEEEEEESARHQSGRLFVKRSFGGYT
jgi:hypothetical protein